MAVRTDAAKVKKVVETDALAWAEIDTAAMDPFITVANVLVEALCVPAGYPEPTLLLIETYLAAHAYAMSDQYARTTVEQVGAVKYQFSFKVGLFLDQTMYGQMAKTLDYLGTLVNVGKPQIKLGVLWIGGGEAMV